MSGIEKKIEDIAIPKKAPGSAGKQTVTDVKHDATALGNDANKGKSGLTGAGQDVAHGNVKNAGQDLTKGKDTMKTTEGDFTKGKSDIGGATKAL